MEKIDIIEKSVGLQKDLEIKKSNKKELDTRFKVGELDEKLYNNNATKLAKDIEDINDAIKECESLLKELGHKV